MTKLKRLIMISAFSISAFSFSAKAQYLINDDFEGTGTPSGWTVYTGSPNFDYSTSPLAGLQSLRTPAGGSSYYLLSPTQDELWGMFLFKTETALPPSFDRIISVLDAGAAGPGIILWSDGKLTVDQGTSFTVSAMSANTMYYVWWHYKKGASSTGAFEAWFSTTSTRPASGSSNYTGSAVITTFQSITYIILPDAVTTGGASSAADLYDNFQVATTDLFGGGGGPTPTATPTATATATATPTPTATATPALVLDDSYPCPGNQDQDAVVDSTTFDDTGQSYTSHGGTLARITFDVKKTGSPTGNAVAKVFAISGGLPTGTALATSDNFNVTTLSTSYALTDFNFSGVNQVMLVNGTQYGIVVEYTSGNGSNFLSVGLDNSAPTYSGGAYINHVTGVGWASHSGDVCFYVYVAGSGATPTPTPLASNWFFLFPQ